MGSLEQARLIRCALTPDEVDALLAMGAWLSRASVGAGVAPTPGVSEGTGLAPTLGVVGAGLSGTSDVSFGAELPCTPDVPVGAGHSVGAGPSVSAGPSRTSGVSSLCDALSGVAHDVAYTDEHVALYLHRDECFQQARKQNRETRSVAVKRNSKKKL